MSRLQLALNVSNLDEAVEFYSKLFATDPYKRKPGYANFAIADPPLKLVLFEGAEGGTINHLGVETDVAAEVEAAEARLAASGLQTTGIDDTICCYAEKVETWVTAPDALRWEWYVKTADSDFMSAESDDQNSAMCCAPVAEEVSSCCAPSTSEPVSLGRTASAAEAPSGCC